jgi:tRNA A37 methylthiotransferase MiaB
MTVHLINPSHLSFGVGVITPRWLFVLAGATPTAYGTPRITDETLEPFDFHALQPGDVVGIGIHTGNALRGYEIGTLARERGATVVFGGIHATLYPDEAQSLGGAHAVVKGDGDVVWPLVLNDAVQGIIQPIYEAGRVDADHFVAARWELLPQGRYMWGSVQTVRGCPKHCSFCSVWRTDGQKPRQRRVDAVVDEIVELRRRGFRFIALADDNFYPVTLTDFAMAERQGNAARLEQLRALRAERFELMERLAQLPSDMVFFTQITMEAAEDTAFLDAMRRANIKGALVGVEAVTPEGLKDVYKGFNEAGEALIARLHTFRDHGVHVLGSFIFGLPSDRPSTFQATVDVANRAGLAFAQFVMLTPYPGTLDFEAWEKRLGPTAAHVGARHASLADPTGSTSEGVRPAPGDVRRRDPREDAGGVGLVLQPAADLGALPLYANTSRAIGLCTAFETIPADVREHGHRHRQRRVSRANRWACLIARPCRRLFVARPLPGLARDGSVYSGTGATAS